MYEYWYKKYYIPFYGEEYLMKKLTVILLIASICLSFTSCLFSEKSYTVAIVTGVSGVTNRSSAQGAYEGIKSYCGENNVTYKYYVPKEDTDDAYLEQVDKAVSNGASLVVIAD
jgi:basic membrane protein A